MTEFKANLVEHGMSMAESFLVEIMRNRLGEFAAGIVGSPFHALCDRLSGMAPQGVTRPFVVWRRMAYFGDTLSHAALLGVAIGLLPTYAQVGLIAPALL